MLNAAVSVPNAVETIRSIERAKTDAQKQSSAQKIERLTAELTSEQTRYGRIEANELAQETETPARRRARLEKNRLRLQLREVRWMLTGKKRAAEAEKKLPYRIFQLVHNECCKAKHPQDGVEIGRRDIAERLRCSLGSVKKYMPAVRQFFHKQDAGCHPDRFKVNLPETDETLALLHAIEALATAEGAEFIAYVEADLER